MIRSPLTLPLLLLPLLLLPTAACSQSTGAPPDAAEIARDLERAAPLADTLRPQLGAAVAGSRRNAIVVAAERVAPSVVSVNVVRRERVQPRSVFEQMLIPPGYEREVPGLGSGFILHPSGVVVTNEHVVRGAGEVVVTLPDGREFEADVVGSDELNDISVLRIRFPGGRTENLPVAPLGRSDGLMIGEWVIAIGNPLGFLLSNTEPTVTAGVVSAVGRNILPQGGDQRGFYLDMIQTDASINPGNSGGPLVNALGEVIGVNSNILSRGGGSEGLGFAIPIDRVSGIVQDLLEDGRVRRAWVGAEVESTPAAGPRRIRDVRVTRVVPGSPAARAGLREGMVVRSVGPRTIRNPLDWEAAVLQGRVGETLRIRVAEGEREREIAARLEELPSMSAERVQALRDLQLVSLTPAIRGERGIANEQGALIVGISEQARAIGLREGDVILQINRLRVRSAEEAARVLGQLGGSFVVVYFERGGRIGSAQFRVG
jgi:serine protease Do